MFRWRIWHAGVAAFLLSNCPCWADTPITQQEWATRVQGLLARNLAPPINIRDVDTDQLVRLRMTVERDGSVKSIAVERSSGHAEIDQAAIDMVKRTGRLPSFTADMKDPHIEIVMPVNIMVAKKDTAARVPPPEPSGRRYSHRDTGFSLDVPALFEIVRPRSDSNYDILVDVVSLLKVRPLPGPAKRFAALDLRRRRRMLNPHRKRSMRRVQSKPG